MKLSAFKKYTTLSENLVFELWNGERVPAHYHLTEIGLVEKNYIDCGGKIRQEKKISLTVEMLCQQFFGGQINYQTCLK